MAALESEGSSAEVLLRMITGFQLTQAISVAARMGIADLLEEGPKSSDDLANATGAHQPSLYRLLRALCAAGLLVERPDRRFEVTSTGALLRTHAPGSLRATATFFGGPETWTVWGDLFNSVRTGQAAWWRLWGMDNWEYRRRNGEASAVFHAAMAEITGLVATTVARLYNFADLHLVVDVGGGRGQLLGTILKTHQSLRGIVFDLPHVVEAAKEHVEAMGVADRCHVMGGSFLESVPGGGDAYILSRVIHDWDDKVAITILRSCREAMARHGRLLLVERVLPNAPTSNLGTFLSDLNMLVSPGGRERTKAEYQRLFEAARFELSQTVPVGLDMTLIEAEPR